MKIIIVSASPKKSFSNSLYFSRVLKFWLMGHETHIIKLKSAKQYNELVAQLPDADALVFTFPVYVDAIPSSLLGYLEKLEHDIADKNLKCRVYGLTNCGFFEGRQCGPSLKMLGNWSEHAGLEWGGGAGIGAGEMVGIMRIIIPINLAILLLQMLITAIIMLVKGNFVFETLTAYLSWGMLLRWFLIYVVLSMGLFLATIKLSRAIVKRKECTRTYRTIFLCPRFLFVFFANLFWIVRGLFHGVMPWRLFRKMKVE